MPKHTEEEVFKSDYIKKAHLQKGFNPHLLDDLVQYILRVKPESKSRAIRLIDLCCGDGSSTFALLTKLDEHEIQVESIVGYDISPSQIEVSTQYSNLDSRLSFQVKDINTLADEDHADVILSLFGLHWIENIGQVTPKIKRCLKSDGLFMFFVPLEKLELFELRRQLIQSPKWKDKFSGFALVPFISDPNDYYGAVSPYFNCENGIGIHGEQNIEFERNRFAEFLGSWMQEVRHLSRSDEQSEYVEDLIQSIPISHEAYPDVKPITTATGTPGIQFVERLSWFHLRNNDLGAVTEFSALNSTGLKESHP